MKIRQIRFGPNAIKRRADADHHNIRKICRRKRQKLQAFLTGNKSACKAGLMHRFAHFKSVDQLRVGVKSNNSPPSVQKCGGEVESHISQPNNQDIRFIASWNHSVHLNPQPRPMALEPRTIRQDADHCTDILLGKAWMQR